MAVEVCARVACDDPELDDALERAASALLDALGCADCELEISLVADEEMRDLNRRYRGKDRSTDVLSFAQNESDSPVSPDGEALAPSGVQSFVHSTERATRQDSTKVGRHAGEDSPQRPSPHPSRHLGDIVISLDTAARQAQQGGWTLQEECTRLCLHGLLHLLDHDHERGGTEAERMQAEEKRLTAVLAAAGIACAHDQA